MRRRKGRRKQSLGRLEDRETMIAGVRALWVGRKVNEKKRDILLHQPGVDLLLLGLLFRFIQ